LYVMTAGYGTGVLPKGNEIAAHPGWLEPDLMIRAELNNRGPLGYPMDEMNAIAGNGIQSGRSTPSVPPQRDDRPEIQIPLPIFSPY
jgi:hypothetical protein